MPKSEVADRVEDSELTYDIVLSTDENGRARYVSPDAERFFDSSREALIGKSFAEVLMGILGEVPETEESASEIVDWTFDALGESRDPPKNVSWNFLPKYNADGKRTGTWLFGRCDGPMHAFSEELVSDRTVPKSARSALIITDPFGSICYANQAFQEIHGYTEVEIKGINPKYLRFEDTPELYDEIGALVERGQRWSGEVINRNRDGYSVRFSALVSPYSDCHGNMIGMIWMLHPLEAVGEELSSAAYEGSPDHDLNDRRDKVRT